MRLLTDLAVWLDSREAVTKLKAELLICISDHAFYCVYCLYKDLQLETILAIARNLDAL
jgi:hypothetical protein